VQVSLRAAKKHAPATCQTLCAGVLVKGCHRKILVLATPAWTFGASVVPWWLSVGLFWEASPVTFTVRDTMSLIYCREASP
jgi:hypothetical protein